MSIESKQISIRYSFFDEQHAVETFLEEYVKEGKMYQENTRLDLMNFIFWLYRHKGLKLGCLSIHDSEL